MQNLHKDWTAASLLQRKGLFVKRSGFSRILFFVLENWYTWFIDPWTHGGPVHHGPTAMGVTPTFYKNKDFVQIGMHIKMHIKL
jgi:hypothetical protein